MKITMNDNPTSILSFDPAAVAIRASTDDAMLEKLEQFAEQLTKYVNLVQQQQQQEQNQATAAAVGNTDSAADTSPNEEMNTLALGSSGSGVKMEGGESGGEVGDAGRQQPVPVKSAAVVENQLDREQEREPDSSLFVRKSPRKHAPRFSLGMLDHRPKKKKKPSPPSQQIRRAPRTLRKGFSGDIEDSKIPRSVGKTRKVLNKHLEKLGLTACFTNGVVSKHGQDVSHLTFSNEWNDLPFDTSETFEWWLGVGATRLDLASPLDPNQYYTQPKNAVPIFWACKQDKGGGSLCHYIGHFRCIRFEKRKVNFKDQARQALIEFKFEHFDASLSQTMASI